MKFAAFTVRATMPQSIAWKRAAEAEGFKSAGAWIAGAVDAYLKARARAGRPLPLTWRRFGRFRVVLMDGSEIETNGAISPPFGIFRGTEGGPRRMTGRALVHLPSRRIIATLGSAGQCKELAAEMAPVLLRDEAGALRLAAQRERERV